MFGGKDMGRGGRRGFAERFGAGGGRPFGRGDERSMERGRFGGGRGGSGRRIFDSGELRLVLLGLIADKARHGYDLIRAIEERTGGAYAPSPGVVYPTLTLLTDMGLIKELQAEGTRKLFEITDDGRTHLAERANEVELLFARLDAIGAIRERTDAVPIRRAVHNLRNVLDYRLGAGLDDDRLHETVALIDEVARKIERL
ncbi:PadR family transcriptional regulator [Sphingomonas sp. H39-1-10]|nr:PadR family transcriptional regulator [Sphingomonas pollutisoli]MDF0491434.1 PadR family transcriptional regulator [Sphingomonas pollutisoli]